MFCVTHINILVVRGLCLVWIIVFAANSPWVVHVGFFAFGRTMNHVNQENYHASANYHCTYTCNLVHFNPCREWRIIVDSSWHSKQSQYVLCKEYQNCANKRHYKM